MSTTTTTSETSSPASVTSRDAWPDAQWVTRAQASALAGVSKTTLRRLEREGAITPQKNAQGWHLYHVEELTEVRRTRVVSAQGQHGQGEPSAVPDPGGQRAAEAFALFDQGHSPSDVVQALRMPPAEVKTWHAWWGQMTGRGLWVSEVTLERMLRGSLAVCAKTPEPGTPALDVLGDEQALVHAVARAVDTARKVYRPQHGSVSELALWLSQRGCPGQRGTLSMYAQALGLQGVTFVERYVLAEWSCAQALAQAMFDKAEQAQRASERSLPHDLGLLPDGTYEVVLSTEHGTQRTWLEVPSPALGLVVADMRSHGQSPTLARLRQMVEREQDGIQDRRQQRKDALTEKARRRRDEAQARAQARAQERDLERAEHRQRMRELDEVEGRTRRSEN